jgi:Cdc6-like AAA superfamily ATPase
MSMRTTDQLLDLIQQRAEQARIKAHDCGHNLYSAIVHAESGLSDVLVMIAEYRHEVEQYEQEREPDCEPDHLAYADVPF